jgi:PIN domain nuclease of toxin-antitoxin system
MKYLIDTHIFIWSLTADSKISSQTKQILLDSQNEIYLSIESLREIAIKHRDGKLDLPDDFQNTMTTLRKKAGIKLLSIKESHLLRLYQLEYPSDHKDPFDHMIICQAIEERMTLISSDRNFPFYRNQGLLLLEN